jgi:cytosine/adenosine deaminase-related metal-dependent hydrolase
MATVYRAAWVLPIAAPPIEDGWVAIDNGRIVSLGAAEPPDGARGEIAYGSAILPGLVNAHTHLELSWMAGRVPPADSMGQWICALLALRRGNPPLEAEQRAAIVAALAAARRSGTIALGDIGNSLLAAGVLAQARMRAVLFHELIGFGPGDARARALAAAADVARAVRPPVAAGLAPHAPYSVSPDLFRAIADEAAARGWPSSVHLGESQEEVEFLLTGGGGIADTLRRLGVWNDAWLPPRVDPAEYLDRLGVLRPGLLAVHATQLTQPALARLAARGCVIVSCPRSNRWVGAGDPPLDDFYASGAAVAFGTDSLASAPDLDMFAELAAARTLSTVPAGKLLESATLTAARALRLDADLGSITAGKRAELIAVRIPEGIEDVEEYLVNGVQPVDIRWLPGTSHVAPARRT